MRPLVLAGETGVGEAEAAEEEAAMAGGMRARETEAVGMEAAEGVVEVSEVGAEMA